MQRTHVIVDTPAAVESRQLPEVTRDAHKILVPVLPSDIDIHTCSRTIRDLLLVAKIRRDEDRIGVIANRIRRNTLTYQALIRFLHTLGIPIVATIRDSQNYVRAAELGIGVHEMKSYIAQSDVEQWQPLVDWLDRRGPRPPQDASAAGGHHGVGTSAADHGEDYPQFFRERRRVCRSDGKGIPGTKIAPIFSASLAGAEPGLARRLAAFVEGITHPVRPTLVVGPGVEILRDGRMPSPGALHAVQPAGVGVRSVRGRGSRRSGREIRRTRARHITSPPV